MMVLSSLKVTHGGKQGPQNRTLRDTIQYLGGARHMAVHHRMLCSVCQCSLCQASVVTGPWRSQTWGGSPPHAVFSLPGFCGYWPVEEPDMGRFTTTCCVLSASVLNLANACGSLGYKKVQPKLKLKP
ncbi:hypothetical protein ACOMHN_063185 [Nucella lapillus]